MRALPLTHVFKHGVAIVDRRAANRVEQCAARRSGERAERDRRIWRAERGQPDLRHLPAGQRGDRGQRIQITGLALVGRHARRGVAFHLLDRVETFARRGGEVLGGDIILEVDKRLAMRPAWRRRQRGAEFRVTRDAECSGFSAAGAMPRFEARGDAENAGAAPQRIARARRTVRAGTCHWLGRTAVCRATGRTNAPMASNRPTSALCHNG